MYLIIGSPLDPCCSQVDALLKARGHDTWLLECLFSDPYRFVWRCAGGRSHISNSRISEAGDHWAACDEIDGVFVRETVPRLEQSWSERDGQYVAAEMQAALLGWLWSLPCTVINRPPAWLFYRPRPPFLYWVPLLLRAGLRTPAAIISNDTERLKTWRSQHEGGSIFSPLTGNVPFRLQTEAEWKGVLSVARHAPVLLQEAHGETQLACVVGKRVLWDGPPPAGACSLEAKLRDFAQSAGLDFVQIAVADKIETERNDTAGWTVISVEPQVQFARFSSSAQESISEVVASLLTVFRGHSLWQPNVGPGALLTMEGAR